MAEWKVGFMCLASGIDQAQTGESGFRGPGYTESEKSSGRAEKTGAPSDRHPPGTTPRRAVVSGTVEHEGAAVTDHRALGEDLRELGVEEGVEKLRLGDRGDGWPA